MFVEPTPVTRAGVLKYDSYPPAIAAVKAWSDPGKGNPIWHKKMQGNVRKQMPLLAKALDRLTTELL